MPNFPHFPVLREAKKTNGGWRVWGIDDGSCGMAPYMPPPPPSASDTVLEFHTAINKRDVEKLDKLLSPDCEYEDLIFYIPFEGKEVKYCFLLKGEVGKYPEFI